jgi:polar amino acid transport system substrate-binding protein
MILLRLVLVLFGICISQSAFAQSSPTPEEMQALAPTGKLRAALYLGGPASVIKDPNSGEMRGVGYELGRDIARRMGVPYEPIIYQTPGLVVEDAASGKWDIAFIAQNPDREKIINYTTAYLKVEHGYLVPSGSPIQTISDVDRPGIRVGVPAGGTVIPVLKRMLKDPKIVEVAVPEAADLIKSGKVEVFAANKSILFALADQLPSARVLEGRYSVDTYAVGTPKGREAGMVYLRQIIESAKAEGLVSSAMQRAGVRGAVQE